ncbi:MAG TPA: DinB family protein [Longimicrobiales bacterium]|nr:DinB family protein [Longimicrobiales bacterium]
MHRTILALALAGACVPGVLHAQGTPAAAAPSSSPFADAARAMLTRYARNLNAAADQMPADKYGFKPTPQQMSYGELMGHVAGSNVLLCSRISGTEAPADFKAPAKDAAKDAVVAAVKQSFDYCQTALAKTTDANMADMVDFFGGRKVTRATALMALTGDWFDHYGAAAIYIRLNGMLPPTAQPRS